MGDIFERAALAGFAASGEGFNGDYTRMPWGEACRNVLSDAREQEWAAILHHNMATAGGLCAAFPPSGPPGCHRPAPGWGER